MSERGRRILVVDDERPMQRILEILLRKLGHEVLCAGNGREALALARRQPVDLVLTDLRMPEMDGLALLEALRAEGQDVPVILITAYGTVDSAVRAMKHGASDYIIRPFENETVELAVERALRVHRLEHENRFLRQQVDAGWHDFVGDSPAMRAVYDAIARAAPTGAAVLITGETGTGKELAAHAIHRASGRSGLFVPINCAAIPEDMLESELFGHVRGAFTGAQKDRAGKFELADGGTLFLDEITEMPVHLQAKLLRVLQEGTVERLGSNRPRQIDFRLVAATNRDPARAVADGRLREDLYYRLNVLTIELPPLRERGEDIARLAEHFLASKAAGLGRRPPRLSAAARDCLMRYAWPGNVRELENIMERALILSTGAEIGPADLPPGLCDGATAAAPAAPGEVAAGDEPALDDEGSLDLQARLEAVERATIRTALARTGNNKTRAARLLGISDRTLWYKLKKLGLA